MKLSQVRRSGRRSFTLVELLIVIAIISVLLSLISSAVWKAVVTANRVRNQNEISQLTVALENFKSKFGIYPPSRFIVSEQFDSYFQGNNRGNLPKSQLHADSVNFLKQIWPRINFDFPNKPGLGSKPWTGIDWNGDGQLTPGEFLLEGDQCLVFFLGGIPGIESNRLFCSGFSTNPQNPAFHTIAIGSEVIPPFFEFDSTRLMMRTPPSRYFSYRDTYGGTPYAYFSSYKTRNGYNRYNTSDCTSLHVWPYAEGSSLSTSSTGLNSTWRYLNPNTFQIISAGADRLFGRGTDPSIANSFWTPANAGTTPASSGAGLDDQSNFHDSTLGTPVAGS